MEYKDLFKNIKYPILLNSFDDLKVNNLPPWNLIKENYFTWKKDFEEANLNEYLPFARMVNDDVIAAFKEGDDQIFLFNLPITKNTRPFKKYETANLWLKKVTEDMFDYINNW